MARRSLAIATVLLLVMATAPVALAEDTDADPTEDTTSASVVSLDPAAIDEGTAVGTVVGSLAVDAAETAPEFALVAGEGDTHNHLFTVEESVVLTGAALDYEALGATLTIRVSATDTAGGEAIEAAVAITLNDVGEIMLRPSDVDENVETGTVIGTLSVGGADVDTTYAFSLVPGGGDDHNQLFTIEGTELRTAAELDFEELGPSLTIRVAATDVATGAIAHEHRLFIVLNDFEVEMTAAEQEILDALTPACDPMGDEFVLWYFPQLDKGTRFSNTFGDERAGGERRHRGADLIGGTKGMPVVAAADGVVSYVGTGETAGHFVIIEHADGWQTRYMHLNNDTPDTDDGLVTRDDALAPGITVGAEVVGGQLIGWIGDSGNAEDSPPHTHFELWHRRHLADPFACLRQAWDWQLVAWDIEGRIL